MNGIGTREPVISEHGDTALHFRKPLSLAEVNRMAPTLDVRRREGRA